MKPILISLILGLLGGAAQAQSDLFSSVSAILEPVSRVDIRTAVNGRIETIDPDEGAEVTQGDVLVSIDARVQKARVAFAQVAADGTGGVARAETALAQAQALLERVLSARKKGAAQAWEVTQTEQAVALAAADLEIAKETKEQSKSQLALELATLEEFLIRAPFPATVLQVFSEPGETIDTQTVIMEIGQLDRLKATAFVPVSWLQTLKAGALLDVTLETQPRQDVQMQVVVIDPRVDPASQTIRVVLELDNTSRDIRVGTSVTVQKP